MDVLSSDYVLLARARGGEPAPPWCCAPRPAQRGFTRPHLAVWLHQRDYWRLGAGGAGVLLPRAGPGRRHRWPGQRLAPCCWASRLSPPPWCLGATWPRDLLYGLVDPRIRKGGGGSDEAAATEGSPPCGLWGGAAPVFAGRHRGGPSCWRRRAMETDFSPPEPGSQPGRASFGTDWMGRDMLARTLAGLSLSIRIGLLTAAVSAGGGLGTGHSVRRCLAAGVDAFISWWIDLVMGIPHILLVILLSIACGRGFTGVVVGGGPQPLDLPGPGHPRGGAPAEKRPLPAGGRRSWASPPGSGCGSTCCHTCCPSSSPG